MTESNLNAALRQFEATEANLVKLERIWSEMEKLVPSGISFGDPENKYEELSRAYEVILKAMPKIEGMVPATVPWSLDEIAQNRLDASELGMIECSVGIETEIEKPGRELREYRFRLETQRRTLVREAVSENCEFIGHQIELLRKALEALKLNPSFRASDPVYDLPGWVELNEAIDRLEMLLGSNRRPDRWPHLRRHLHFAMCTDLTDIIQLDWPSVLEHIMSSVYGENDPIPVTTTDLSELVAAKPKGPIATKLKWSSLKNEEFERLIYSLICSHDNYENPEWLTKVNAPDRGRDISAYRVFRDPLSGAIRQRVIFQCKHWLSKSIAPGNIAELKERMKLWEPPRVDVHIIATSGRFTSDSVTLIEQHNLSDSAMRIEMWPESHLERLLAARPGMIAEFHLR